MRSGDTLRRDVLRMASNAALPRREAARAGRSADDEELQVLDARGQDPARVRRGLPGRRPDRPRRQGAGRDRDPVRVPARRPRRRRARRRSSARRSPRPARLPPRHGQGHGLARPADPRPGRRQARQRARRPARSPRPTCAAARHGREPLTRDARPACRSRDRQPTFSRRDLGAPARRIRPAHPGPDRDLRRRHHARAGSTSRWARSPRADILAPRAITYTSEPGPKAARDARAPPVPPQYDFTPGQGDRRRPAAGARVRSGGRPGRHRVRPGDRAERTALALLETALPGLSDAAAGHARWRCRSARWTAVRAESARILDQLESDRAARRRRWPTSATGLAGQILGGLDAGRAQARRRDRRAAPRRELRLQPVADRRGQAAGRRHVAAGRRLDQPGPGRSCARATRSPPTSSSRSTRSA